MADEETWAASLQSVQGWYSVAEAMGQSLPQNVGLGTKRSEPKQFLANITRVRVRVRYMLPPVRLSSDVWLSSVSK